MSLCEIIKKYNSCSFLYDPKITITFPKFKVLITYDDELVKILGCNILVRSDLDKTALFFVEQDAKTENRKLNKYKLSLFKKSKNSDAWEDLIKLKFNTTKHMFETI